MFKIYENVQELKIECFKMYKPTKISIDEDNQRVLLKIEKLELSLETSMSNDCL